MPLTLLNLSQAKETAKAEKVAAAAGFTLQNVEQFANLFVGLKTAAGKNVNRETAMRVSAVLSCVRILMEDVSAMPLLLKRKTKKGADDAIDHPAYRLLKSGPNPLQTSVELREHVMFDLMTTGSSAVWQTRKGGDLQALWPLRSGSLHYRSQRRNGDLVWDYAAPELSREFTQADLWRTSIMSNYIIDGRALILLAREAIGLAIAAEEQGARLFSNGIQTNLALTVENELTPDARTQLRTALNEANAGSANSWKPLLLEAGIKADKIGLTAQESQYIEARNYQTTDIARIFRIPDVLLGISSGKSSTYASAEQFFQSYVKHTLLPWCNRLEQTIERDLILPSEQDLFVRHQLNFLLRADQKTRFETYQLAIQNGVMSPQEARKAEDWDEVDGLDEHFVPVTLQTIGQAKQNEENAKNPALQPGAAPGKEPNNPKGKPDPNNNPDNNPTDRKAQALAENIAASIIVRESREFEKARGKGLPVNFAEWLGGHISRLTGASTEHAQLYVTWRTANQFGPEADAEAKKRLVNLCLGVNCAN
jgi:HK97 family phage portal protein